MENLKKIKIKDGVTLNAVKADKFKNSCLSFNFILPLNQQTAIMNSLIPMVLKRGSKKYSDMTKMSEALDNLYGTRLYPVVRKKGEVICVGFVADFIEKEYTLTKNEDILKEVCEILEDIIFNPITEGDAFLPEYFDGEKANLEDLIKAEINDKRAYAQQRMIENMCKDEAYGISRLGNIESLKKLTNKELYSYYKNTLLKAKTEIFYCGSESETKIEQIVNEVFLKLNPSSNEITKTKIIEKAEKTKEIHEKMEISQGKLSIGLRTGITMKDELYYALILFNAVFGGTVTSKLFENVREKLSLCYYASSRTDKHKGIMVINSGIEFSKFEIAKAEIIKQYNACKNGDITDNELLSAKKQILSDILAIGDTIEAVEDFYLSQIIEDVFLTPEVFYKNLDLVTKKQVIEAANKTTIDTIYFLEGQEN